METFEDRFRRILRSKELWVDVLNAFREHTGDNWESLDAADRIIAGRGIIEEIEFEYDELLDDLDQKLRSIFQARVIDQIGELAPLTAKDLIGIAIAQLTGLRWRQSRPSTSGISEDQLIPTTVDELLSNSRKLLGTQHDEQPELKAGMARFVAFARLELRFNRCGSTCFNLGKWATSKDDETTIESADVEDGLEETKLAHNLWVSETDLCVELIAERRRDELGATFYKARACVFGGCTSLAMPLVEERLRLIVESLAKTARLAATNSEKATGKQTIETVLLHLSDGPAERANLEQDLPAPLNFLTCGDGGRILKTCLSACFNSQIKQDSLMERLRNATLLLSHADQMESDPLALSLSFAAIEALVCEKEENVGKQIRQHIPTLLESVPSLRTGKRRDALYDLYALRSQVLHGSNLSVSSEASSVVCRIAAGAVRAISVWKAHREMIGEKPTWKDLITELIIASRNDQAVIPEVPGLGELLPNMAPK